MSKFHPKDQSRALGRRIRPMSSPDSLYRLALLEQWARGGFLSWSKIRNCVEQAVIADKTVSDIHHMRQGYSILMPSKTMTLQLASHTAD